MAAFDAQYLESGKALCGKNFPGFVGTFNWLVDFCRNLKGDGDLDALCGRVKVDAADPRRPVVRLNADGLGGGGGGACSCKEAPPAPFKARASLSSGTLKVELYSLSSGLVRVNATEADWSEDEAGFGATAGWVTVYEGAASAKTFSVEVRLFTTVDDTSVKKVAAQTAACRIVTGATAGTDGWSVSDGVATLTATVPVASVSAAGEVTAQHHEGVVLFYAPVPHLKCGDDSNIVFTLGTDGAISADVYYK